MNERWITLKDGRRIPIKTNSEYMNTFIRSKSKYKLGDDIHKKEYLADEYHKDNVNKYFEKIETYDELEDFREDLFNKRKIAVLIEPKKHRDRQWVEFINKIDDKNISFSVLSQDFPYSRRTRSTIKNFVKNYQVHLED